MPKNNTINSCHDCGKKIIFKGKEIKNGKYLVYKEGDKEYQIFKCNECYKKSPELRNYQPCEVYSRIVGYLRPVQQWNPAKVQEYKERKMYKIYDKK